MDPRLFLQAVTKLSAGFLIVAILLFLPAGTIAYGQGWLLIAIP